MLSNAGQKGGIHPEFTPFSPQEIKRFLGLYMLHGLTLSSTEKMKFKSQLEDLVHHSNVCHAVFGENAEKRHKHFKTFFSCQDPMLPTPSRKMQPNPTSFFLSHGNLVFMTNKELVTKKKETFSD
jgi:hypothetical protein